jgi:predicted O-linked N-acetylglucosamine transferase (SPINDLY family)
MPTIPEAFILALQHHQAGRLGEAEALYYQILQTQPRHAEVLYRLGLLAHQAGRQETAVTYLTQAIQSNPAEAEFHKALGEAYRAQGKLPEALAHYRQALALRPDSAEVAFSLGVAYQQQGHLAEAATYYRQAVALQPALAEAHNNLGTALAGLGELDDALACYRQALALRPEYAEAHFNLANALKEQEKLDGAMTAYRQAIALRPEYAEAYMNLGVILQRLGKLDEAIGNYQQALTLDPRMAGAYFNLGIAHHSQGNLEGAVAAFRQAVTLRPEHAEAHDCLGNALFSQGKLEEAADHLRRAVEIRPGFPEAHSQLGSALEAQGELAEAVTHLQEALALKPRSADLHVRLGRLFQQLGHAPEAITHYRQALVLEPHCVGACNNLGILMQEQGKLDEAIGWYQKALAINPETVEAWVNLASALHEQGRLDEANDSYQRAMRLKPSPGVKVRTALLVPIIPYSMDELVQARSSLEERVSDLLRQDLCLTRPVEERAPTPFYITYQGLDDRDLQQRIAQMYEKICPALAFVSPHCRSLPAFERRERVRIGVVSRYLWNHTIGMLMRGIIAHLSRKLFSVTVFFLSPTRDPMSEIIAQSADRAVPLPQSLDGARQLIAQETLDILFYPEVGMDPLTYFLAFSRLAPIQCVTWGHPVTTGIQAMDFFVSSDLMERKHAELHYAERLVRLGHLPTYYYRPSLHESQPSRQALGLGEDRRLYVCPQSLFKLHPDFDAVLGAVLREDRTGEVILIEGHRQHWNKLLMDRLRKSIPGVTDRIRFLPRLSAQDFLHLLASADVILDPLHWSGGSTSFQALAFGTPIITLPSGFMRGRVTYGCYRQIGMMDCVAGNAEEYVGLAVGLATNPVRRRSIREKILATNAVLFENPRAIRDLEQFFVNAMRSSGGQREARVRGSRLPPGEAHAPGPGMA